METIEGNIGNPSFQRDWAAYYRAVEGRPPRETLLRALAEFDQESPTDSSRLAVDLGCGDGRDTVELLQRGWRVLAIDGEPEALERLKNRPDIAMDRLEICQMRFENLVLPPAIHLINASFCLPFCPSDAFPQMWQTITDALVTGGRFCGHLFGDRDSWAIKGTAHYLTREELDALLSPFEVEFLDEEAHPGKTALGDDKFWHIYNIVIRKVAHRVS